MPLAGQDAIESVSQAMFLTVQPMGINQGDFAQGLGLYRQESTYDRSGNPYVITGPMSAVLASGRMEVWSIRWTAPRVTGDEARIINSAGDTVWQSVARSGLPEVDDSVRYEIWTGARVSVLESGTLYVTYRQFGRTG